ncbi:MAG: DUF5127 domain-containing protein [Acidimicrobiales bacterium]
MDRRRFLTLAGGGLVAAPATGLLAGLLAGCDSTTAPHTAETPTSTTLTPGVSPVIVSTGAPFRPPAVPLAVRSPYLHAWLPGDTLPGTWAMRWSGQETQLAGIVRIDGKPFVWAGAPLAGDVEMTDMAQESLHVTASRSVFTLAAAGVSLTAEFLSPIEPGDPRLQSVPLSLVTATVSATDGQSHDVQLYADISGGWASGTTSDEIQWALSTTDLASHWTIELASPEIFTEHGQMAAWGSMLWSTAPNGSALSYQSGRDWRVRRQFAESGRLLSTVDPRFRAIDDDPVVFGYSHDLGAVSSPVGTSFVLGHLRNPVIEYMGAGLPPAWARQWGHSWGAMVDDFFRDAPQARGRAAELDRSIIAAATAKAGAGYAQLCTLAALQAYGACELVTGLDNQTWGFLKEIGSGNGTSTVDCITATSPIWLYLDPGFLAMLLDPILSYASSGEWQAPWAPHDLGYFYPTADGHASTTTTASGEQMPVQESGALLALAEALAQRMSPATGRSFLARYQTLWSQWAGWLLTQLPSPPKQLTADDFINSLDHAVNLGLLGIIGLGAAGKIFARLGDGTAASHWTSTAQSLVPKWQALSMDPSGRHLELTQGAKGSWGTTYNAYLDRLIGTDLVPSALTAIQAAWYSQQMERYGLPFESAVPHWTRVAWQGWTVAWLSDFPVAHEMIAGMARYINETPQRVPFSDTYWTTTGAQVLVWPVFDRARPVVGGLYALLTESR